MGGLLFNLGRVSKERYLEIEASLAPYLKQLFGEYYRIPRYYGNKPDFGDMDIIVSSKGVKDNWQQTREQIINDLKLKKYKSVGHVFSTNYMDFQVDYFLVNHQYFESTYNFMCFNDLGNLLGKILRKFNLKYGDEGLAYVYRREDGHYKRDLPVTTSLEKILSFIGLDYETWSKGFDSLETMFEWVVQSPYFSVTPYLDRAASMDKRLNERRTIQKFIDWLEQTQLTKTYQYLQRDAYIPLISDYFPESNLTEQIRVEKEREEIVKQINTKFNGHLVMEITKLEGKALGEFINNFKKQFEDFDQFVLETTAEDVKKQIELFLNGYKES